MKAQAIVTSQGRIVSLDITVNYCHDMKLFKMSRRNIGQAGLAVLKTAYQLKHAKGGRKPKLSLEDLLMATLQYVREYRTYEQIAADFGIHESNLIRRSQWVEVTLVQSGFTISRTPLSSEDTVMIDSHSHQYRIFGHSQ
ncbi:transposase-like protein%2C IS1381 ISSpn7 [Streptococcus pneumoniae]|nr:transposase-like protein%2C IS1381 ISSpn7 [Streptococcus pneumoniae]